MGEGGSGLDGHANSSGRQHVKREFVVHVPPRTPRCYGSLSPTGHELSIIVASTPQPQPQGRCEPLPHLSNSVSSIPPAECLTSLRNRQVGSKHGHDDILIVVCDGLTGLPDAIEAVWPQATIQTCVVHLLRGSFRYASYNDRKRLAATMRPIYTAPSVDAAQEAFDEFEAEWGSKYPAIINLWHNSWDVFVPFLDYPPEIRRVVYTTNMIESINYQLRKVTKTRGHFPTEKAALKLLYLAVRNITTERGGTAGTGTHGWKACLNALAIYFPNRINIA